MSQWQIESGVPLTPLGNRRSRDTGAMATLRRMAVGQSVAVPWCDALKVTSCLTAASQEGDKQFARREVEGGIRVWRLR